MAKQKRNKRNINPRPQQDDIFDVRKNLNKLRHGRTTYNSSQTESYYADSRESNISSIKSEEMFSNSYGLEFTESMYNRYDKLKDELNTEVKDLKQEISSQGQGIKDELNKKFYELSENKLSINLFWKIIGGIVAFVLVLGGVIYTLSLKDFGKKIDSNVEKIEVIQNEVDSINFKLGHQEKLLKELKPKNKE